MWERRNSWFHFPADRDIVIASISTGWWVYEKQMDLDQSGGAAGGSAGGDGTGTAGIVVIKWGE